MLITSREFMANEHKKELVAPCSFPFPFEPYPIQVEFMKALYQVIEEKKIGIFESPTGTGKSLSLICGTLSWLRDHIERFKHEIEETLSSENNVISTLSGGNDPFWVEEFAQKQLINAEVEKAIKLKKFIEKRENQLRNMRKSNGLASQNKTVKSFKRKRESEKDETILLMEQAKKEIETQKTDSHDDSEDSGVLDEFALDEYESDEENKTSIEESEDNEQDVITRVFFCSRTHSQLSQFIHELQKSPFGNRDNKEDGFSISVATMASRNSLCINDSVRKLGSIHQMNEKCLEMQKNIKKKTQESSSSNEPKRRKRERVPKKTCRCYSNSEGMSGLTNKIVGDILDVEELVKKGKEIEACPYYAARRALPYCQLVVVPYQILLHEPTRLASGINIQDSVIIIDEAHNLVEAINAMYSCQVSSRQLARALDQLTQYSQKFSKRLKAKNLYYVKQLMYVIRQLLSVTSSTKSTESSGQRTPKGLLESKLLKLVEFLFDSSLDNINFHKLLRYCKRSKISMKLNGFVGKCEVHIKSGKPRSMLTGFLKEIKNSASADDVTQLNDDVTMRSPLMHIESFLLSLTSSHADGRVAITTGSEPSIKFLLLNPAVHFKAILDQCRSLIVAGGTMQPSSCMIDQLISQAERASYASRIVEFSCGHVIDGSKQLLPIALSAGPSNEPFQFTFEKRSSNKMINDLGRMLVNMFNIIPGGVVCFFASYDYENVVYQRWKDEGIIAKLEIKKKVFREPKKTSECAKVLSEYSSCIARTRKPLGKMNGSCLLCVVGGKMSEGINFADDLGRCVVMVGLPYPNMHSPELKEKISYLTNNMPRHVDGRTAGQVHYEGLCMKAVNQSIGRAIRHKDDFACLLLIDQRFGKPAVANKLPKWIGKHLKKCDHFGSAFSAVRKFFFNKLAEE